MGALHGDGDSRVAAPPGATPTSWGRSDARLAVEKPYGAGRRHTSVVQTHCSSDAQTSPQHLGAVVGDLGIGRDHGEAFEPSLRDDHAVERITVQRRQPCSLARMAGADRQLDEASASSASSRSSGTTSLPIAALISASQMLAALKWTGTSPAAISSRARSDSRDRPQPPQQRVRVGERAASPADAEEIAHLVVELVEVRRHLDLPTKPAGHARHGRRRRSARASPSAPCRAG